MFYALRHKPTGHFLPQPPHKGRGFTNTEPTDKHPPRLHCSLNSARQALDWWLSGKWRCINRSWDDEGDLTCQPVASRKPEDMEIVQCELSVTKT